MSEQKLPELDLSFFESEQELPESEQELPESEQELPESEQELPESEQFHTSRSTIASLPGLRSQVIPPITSYIEQRTEAIETDINDLLQREASESIEEFEFRRRITISVTNIPKHKICNITAVTIGFMLFKKVKLGLTYDSDIETVLANIVTLLQT